MTERRRVPVERPKFGGPVPDVLQEQEAKTPGDDAPQPAEDRSRDPVCTCPRLDAADWHEVESDWTDIAFVSGALPAIAGVPVGYGGARRKLGARARHMGATVDDDAMLLLGPGQFRRAILLEVDDVPEGARGFSRPGGIAFSRLVAAPPGKVKGVVSDTREAAKRRYGRKPDRVWLWFLTCGVCSASRDFETLVVAHYRRGRLTG